MKKLYTILSVLVLAVLLIVGVRVVLFPAEDAKAPKLTFAGLFNGKYAQQSRTYFADAFPQSDALKGMNATLNSFYKFSGFAGEEGVQLIINMDTNAADGGEALKEQTPAQPDRIEQEQPQQPTTSISGEMDKEIPTEEPTQPTEPEPEEDVEGVVENLGQALLIGDRAVEVPYGDYDSLSDYADAVTGIAEALGSGIRTFSIAVPNAAEFYLPKEYHSGDNSQLDMIDYAYEHMGDSVHTVDAYSAMKAHKDEYIFFRSDHHWTQLGAYYAYSAWCDTAGEKAVPLEKFEKGEYTGFLGSMYNLLSSYSQSSVLRDNPDTVEYYRPYVEAKARYYPDATLNEEYVIGVISSVGDNVSNKYLCFLGGDHPVTIIRTDVKNNKTCLILKESYGNAFAPWLASHYSKIIVVDPREFNRDGMPSLDLVSFAKEQGVNDCMILNYPIMLNSDSYISWLNRLVQ